jgi:hypothetical protein
MKISVESDFGASLIEARPLAASRSDAGDLGQGWSTPDFRLHRLSTELQVSPRAPLTDQLPPPRRSPPPSKTRTATAD